MTAFKNLACKLAVIALAASGCATGSSPGFTESTGLVAPSGEILRPPCPASAGCVEGFLVGQTVYGLSCHGVQAAAVGEEVLARGDGVYEEARAIEDIPPELWLAVRGDVPCAPAEGEPLLYDWYLATSEPTPADLERWGERVRNFTVPQPNEQPMIDVWYLNPTSDVVELRTESREPDSNGGTEGNVSACDISGASWTLVELQTWEVMVNGMVVLDSSAELPDPGPGEALEVVLTRHPDGTHAVEFARVRPVLSEAELQDRHRELRAGMDC